MHDPLCGLANVTVMVFTSVIAADFGRMYSGGVLASQQVKLKAVEFKLCAIVIVVTEVNVKGTARDTKNVFR